MAPNVMENVVLSEDQKKFYWKNGYLVLNKLIDFATLYSCKQRFIRICKGVEETSNMTVMKERSLIGTGAKGEDLINKVQDIVHDEVFSTYTENPVLLNVVSQIIGDEITAAHSMLINKPPGTGRHPTHQDMYYFPFRPPNHIIAAWTAIDEATRDNGCLYVVPSTHKINQLYEHGYPEKDGITNKMYHGIVDEDILAPTSSWVHLEMSPGDTVLFHPLLLHGSGPNVTTRYRKSISCHYMWSGCHMVDVTGTPQQLIAEEVEAIIRKKGANIKYSEYWRLKSKQVRGPKSHI